MTKISIRRVPHGQCGRVALLEAEQELQILKKDQALVRDGFNSRIAHGRSYKSQIAMEGWKRMR